MFWWNHRSHYLIIHVFLEIYQFVSICFIKHTNPRTCRFLKSLRFCCVCFFSILISAVAYIYSYGKVSQPLGKHTIHPQRKGWCDSQLEGAAIFASGIGIHVGESLGWRDRMTVAGGMVGLICIYIYMIYIYIYYIIYIYRFTWCVYIYIYLWYIHNLMYTYDIYIYDICIGRYIPIIASNALRLKMCVRWGDSYVVYIYIYIHFFHSRFISFGYVQQPRLDSW